MALPTTGGGRPGGQQLDAYVRAANYLTVGQIYLMDNPLVRRPLRSEDIKPRLLGHWGTSPGLKFLYAHLSRCIKAQDLNAIFVCGPGHGGPAVVANTWLEGTYSERYPHIGRNRIGMQRLFRQFSFPGGIPSHCSPETPGSIHEGGELGYSLSMPSAPHSTTPTWSWPASWVTVRPRPGRPRPDGTRTSSWIQFRTAPCCRSCISTVTRSRHQRPGSNPHCRAALALRRVRLPPVIVEGGFDGERHMAVHRRMAAALDAVYAETGTSRMPVARRAGPARGPRGQCSSCGPLRDGPDRRWSTGCPSREASAPTSSLWPRCGPIRSTWHSWRRGCAAIAPKSFSPTTAVQ